MPLSYKTYTGSSGSPQSSFTLDFPYILKDHIKVYYGRDILANTQTATLVSGTDYNFTSDNIIQLIGSTLNSGTTTGNPHNLANGVVLTIERDTPDSSQIVDFADGSNLIGDNLNNANLQNLFVVQEQQDKNDLSAAKSISAESAATTATNNVATLSSTQFRSDGSQAMTGDLDVGNNKIKNLADPSNAQDAVTKAYLERTGSIQSAQILDGTIVDADINASANIAGSKLADDAITNAKIADDSIDSEHYVDGSIDTAHIGNSQVTTDKIADDAVTNAKIAANAVGTTEIDTGAITTPKIANSQVTSTKIADGNVNTNKLASSSVNSNKIADAAVTENKLGSDAVTSAKIADNAVTNAKIADAELKTLANMQSGTASKLADTTALTSDIADLNQLDGMTKETSVTNSDTKFPTSKAVVDFVANQIAPVGGLEVIADEDSFPATQPVSGVVISISNADGLVINNAGEASNARTVGSGTDNVTIKNFPTSLRNKTLANELGLLVSSTGASQEYNYHKLLAKETDVLQLSDDINDFNSRYRVENTLPAANDSSNHDGDLVYAKDVGKIYVYSGDYNGTPVGSFGEVQSIGSFFIATLSPAFDGTTTDFTITNAPSSAEQILLIIEGVLQKPNSGSSTPGEGFALSGSTVKLAAAPPTGASYHAVIIGSTVNIGTPSDNTVTTSILQNASVTTAKIADANVTTAKIANSAITNDKLNNNSITTAKINDSQITTAKIAANAVTQAKIAADAVGTTQIADDAVTAAQIADDAVTAAQIADDAVTTAKIAAGAITNSQVAANAIGPGTIVSNAVTTPKIADDAVTDAKINGMAASKLTGALPAISGASLTNLPKSKNKVINGEMRVSQRGQSFANANNQYTLDRFRVNGSHDGAVTISQDASGPPGFANSLKVDVTTADTSLASGQYIQLTQRIEAQNLQDLAYGTSGAKTITVSFWVKSNVTGTYTYSMQQTDNSAKQTSSQYTINTANTWEKKTFTYAGDVNGVINDDNMTGMNIYWNLAIGTQYTTGTPRSSWTTFNDPDFAAGQTADLLASASNEWYLTGVMFEIGSVATDFEHLSIQEELRLCQRYYMIYAEPGATNQYQLFNIHAYSTAQLETTIDYSWANLRAIPNLVQGSGTNYYAAMNAGNTNCTFGAFLFYQPSKRTALLFQNTLSGNALSTGQAYRCMFNNMGAYIHLDAEL